jgi:hypothetical protein
MNIATNYPGMAFTQAEDHAMLLCCHAGFDPRTPISDQGYSSPSNRSSTPCATSFLKSFQEELEDTLERWPSPSNDQVRELVQNLGSQIHTR